MHILLMWTSTIIHVKVESAHIGNLRLKNQKILKSIYNGRNDPSKEKYFKFVFFFLKNLSMSEIFFT